MSLKQEDAFSMVLDLLARTHIPFLYKDSFPRIKPGSVVAFKSRQ